MRNRRIATQDNCTIDNVSIVDESSFADSLGMKMILEMKGHKTLKKFLVSVTDSFKDTKGSFDDLASSVVGSDRQAFLDQFKDYTKQEGEFLDFLGDLNEVFSETDISFQSSIESLDDSYEKLDQFSEGFSLQGLFPVPSEIAEATRMRDEANAELKKIQEDIESVQEDIATVQSEVTKRITETLKTNTFDVRIQRAVDQKLDEIKKEEAEIVKTLRKLKKSKGKSSKNEIARINKRRRQYQEELLDVQKLFKGVKNMDPDVFGEEIEKVKAEVSKAESDLVSKRNERDALHKEEKALIKELGEKREALRSSGYHRLLHKDDEGKTMAMQKWEVWESSQSRLFEDIEKQFKALAQRVKDNRSMKPRKISIPYIDACLLLHAHFGKKAYSMRGLKLFLQMALLGQRCLTREDWNSSNMFGDTYWKNQLTRVTKYYTERYGSLGIVAEAIKEAKVPPNFKQYLKNPNKNR